MPATWTLIRRVQQTHPFCSELKDIPEMRMAREFRSVGKNGRTLCRSYSNLASVGLTHDLNFQYVPIIIFS